MEVQNLRLGLRRWPRIVLAPYIRPRLKHIGLWHRRSLVLEIKLKERKLDVLPEILAGLRIKRHIAQMIAVRPRPASMHPRSFDNRVHRAWIVLLDRVINPHRSHQVLRVIPSANSEHRAVNIAK